MPLSPEQTAIRSGVKSLLDSMGKDYGFVYRLNSRVPVDVAVPKVVYVQGRKGRVAEGFLGVVGGSSVVAFLVEDMSDSTRIDEFSDQDKAVISGKTVVVNAVHNVLDVACIVEVGE